MIVYNLICTHQHTFEGWFASGSEFERQSEQGLIGCPACGDHKITRLPSGPHVRRTQLEPPAAAEQEVDLESLLEGLRQIMEGSEDVGEQFTEEARRIHYREAPLRNIRGVTTLNDAMELLEEGVPVLPLAVARKKDLH
jgi:hypothetical protein